MKGILIIGGEAPLYRYIEHEFDDADMVVAADSGLDTAFRMGIVPDIVIGDMDSLKNTHLLDNYSPSDVIRFPEDKDLTDTELGIQYLRETGCEEIILVGGGGGRTDHFLGIVYLFDRDFSPRICYTHTARMQIITESIKVPNMNGRLVSFFPVGDGWCRMKSKGLKWPLNNLKWKRGNSGISNLAVANPFIIEVLEGRLLMVNQLEDVNI